MLKKNGEEEGIMDERGEKRGKIGEENYRKKK